MLEVDIYNSNGQKKGKFKLDPEVFGRKINQTLLRQVARAYADNKRVARANTKTRSQVRGGGRKPWRQKGTGRARAGSSRSPIWQGGGVVFGPTSAKNYNKKVSKSIKNQAVCMVLSAKVSKNRLLVLEKLVIDKPKTKELSSFLIKLPVEGSVLLILPSSDEKIIRAGRNLPYLEVISAQNINAYSLLKYNYLIIIPEAAKFLENKYSSSKDSSVKIDKKDDSAKSNKPKVTKK